MFAFVRVTVRVMNAKHHGIWHELRVIRERTGYSSAALARQAGMARSYVWQLENGQRWPNATVTKKLADALHVPYTVIARTNTPTPETAVPA